MEKEESGGNSENNERMRRLLRSIRSQVGESRRKNNKRKRKKKLFHDKKFVYLNCAGTPITEVKRRHQKNVGRKRTAKLKIMTAKFQNCQQRNVLNKNRLLKRWSPKWRERNSETKMGRGE